MNRRIFRSISHVAVVAALAALAGVAQLSAQNAATTVSVNTTASQHAIDPRIYGGAFEATSDITQQNFPTNRWGGNNESEYNWEQDANNLDADWYFETFANTIPVVPGGGADSFIQSTFAANRGAEPYMTIPMLPYIATLPPPPNFYNTYGNANGCNLLLYAWSFSVTKYGPQTGSDPYCADAGNGISTATGNPDITGNNPLDAYVPNSVAIQQGWLAHLIGKWGNSQYPNGIKYYILDNEPSLWASTHRDVHPAEDTYNELWTDIQAYGGAIKAADPNAYVIGPEEWIWWAMWESGHDQNSGTGAGSDYATHGNTYWYPWLLQQLAAYKAANGHSLIDGLSVHCYTDASSNWNVATREMWDPTYKDPNWEGTLGLNSGILEFIPLMHQWVNAAFPNGGGPDIGCTEWSNSGTGTLTDITYQADMLGIFGYYQFNFANFWTVPAAPVNLATQMYRNYDGNYSTFGNTSVQTTVVNPDNLSSFSALRSSDGNLTVMVINKQTGTTPVTINLAGFTAGASATAYQVSSYTQTSITNLGAVTPLTNTIVATLPSQSVTLYVIPPATSAPGAPTGLTAVPTNSEVQLNWNNDPLTSSYQVWAQAAGGSYIEVAAAVTTNSYLATGLTNGVLYSFYVTASNNLGTSGPSNIATATPAGAPPNAPAGLAAKAGSQEVGLSWTASPFANSYQVWYATSSNGTYTEAAANDTNTSYTVTGLTNGTPYYFYVTATNTYGTSGNSAIVSATPSLVVPAAPTIQRGYTELTLNWTGTLGATSYTIYRAATSTGTYSSIASGVTENLYVNTGLTNSTTYYYKVAAQYPAGLSAQSALASTSPNSSAPRIPGTPVAVTGNGQVALTWTKSSAGTVTAYQVWYDVVGGSSYTEAASSLSNSTLTYTVTGLTNGVQYKFFVGAANSTTYYSPSAQVTATPALAIPGQATGLAAQPGNAVVTLSWTAVGGAEATSYNVYQSTTSGGEGTTPIATGISGTSYVVTGLTNGTIYYFKVAGVNSLGTGTLSSEVSATPNVEYDLSTNAPPPLDGSNTGAWLTAAFVPMAHDFNTHTPDTATYKTLWDSNYFYVLVSVQDSTLVAPNSSNVFTGDSVELYFSGTDTTNTSYGATDFQYGFPYGFPAGGAVVAESDHSPASLVGVLFGQQNITGGYQMAMALPWTTLGTTPVAAKQYGFDVMINDATSQGTRDGKLAWFATVDSTWSNPSLMGPLVLIQRQAQTIGFTAASPVTYGVSPITLSATGGASGNPVTFSIVSGPGSLSGTNDSVLTVTGAGTIVVAANQAGNANYYGAAQVTQSIVVNQAPLTVTANNASMAVGAAVPTFTASYSGFVNGEGAGVLSGSPSLTTTATSSSPAGTYPITAAVGSLTAANYSFSFVNGTLSIVAAPTVVITTSAVLSGSAANGYTATIKVTNSGTGAASNVVLSTATLGSATGSPLPQNVASIPAGGFTTFSVSFAGSAGADGAGVKETYSGTYTGGSFSASVRSVTLP